MQTLKPIILQSLRRLILFIGLIFFIFFTYRASHEVANPKIADGVERTQLATTTTRYPSTLNSTSPEAARLAAAVPESVPDLPVGNIPPVPGKVKKEVRQADHIPIKKQGRQN